MIKKVLTIIVLSILSISFATERIPSCFSAVENMNKCLQAITDKKDDLSIYTSFFWAINDKDDDPGYYPLLRDTALESGISKSKLVEMWNEYGITDVARKEFLAISPELLVNSLKRSVSLK